MDKPIACQVAALRSQQRFNSEIADARFSTPAQSCHALALRQWRTRPWAQSFHRLRLSILWPPPGTTVRFAVVTFGPFTSVNQTL